MTSNILGSMKKDGSRLDLHPADVKGVWTRWRRVVFAVLIGFYVLAPFIPVGGHPMIQLDVQHRRFYLFGWTFNSQDFWMVVLLLLAFAFGLLLVTAWKGRVWCGWGCPQTVFLEGLYRPIERWFDGPREVRIRLAEEPMSFKKFARRAGKYAVFLALSLGIAHTATALFVSPKELWLMIEEGPASHLEAFGLTSASPRSSCSTSPGSASSSAWCSAPMAACSRCCTIATRSPWPIARRAESPAARSRSLP